MIRGGCGGVGNYLFARSRLVFVAFSAAVFAIFSLSLYVYLYLSLYLSLYIYLILLSLSFLFLIRLICSIRWVENKQHSFYNPPVHK